MAERCIFGRLIPAMVTPFKEDLDLDLPRAQKLALRLIEGGCDSVLVNGTTGESPTVFYPQKIELFKAVIGAVDGKAPIIANVGDNCTADSVDFAKEVVKLGVQGIMLVVPYYNKPPQEGLYRHFGAIASAVDVPVVLYNIPGRTGINMLPETTLKLANDFENIVAVKEASGNLEQAKTIIDNAPDGFYVYSGDDSLTIPMMELGGEGVISTIANVTPQLMKQLVEAQANGDTAAAKAMDARLQPLMKELFITANPIMVKKALELIGFPVGGLRLPLIEANEEQTAGLEKVLREVGVLNKE